MRHNISDANSSNDTNGFATSDGKEEIYDIDSRHKKNHVRAWTASLWRNLRVLIDSCSAQVRDRTLAVHNHHCQ